ncbi:hypothetical protein ATCC90586_007636 [Pythium insidiosum]|nr:hypothetical protein ATCC90586_007636 [Pythium insidiosum]
MLDLPLDLQQSLQHALQQHERPDDDSFAPLSLTLACLLRYATAQISLPPDAVSLQQIDVLSIQALEHRLSALVGHDSSAMDTLRGLALYIKLTRALLRVCHAHLAGAVDAETANHRILVSTVDLLSFGRSPEPLRDRQDSEDSEQEKEDEDDESFDSCASEPETPAVVAETRHRRRTDARRKPTGSDDPKRKARRTQPRTLSRPSHSVKQPAKATVAVAPMGDAAGIMRRAVARDSGDGQIVVETMRRFGEDVRLQRHGLRALKSVIRRFKRPRKKTANGDNSESESEGESGSAEDSDGARSSDSQQHDASDQGETLAHQQELIRLVVERMQQHVDTAALQRDGLFALSEFASQAPENVAPLSSFGGIAALMQAMALLPDDEDAQVAALSILGHPSVAHDTVVVRVPPESHRLVLSAMRRFPLNERLQGLGTLALSNLSLRSGAYTLSVEQNRLIPKTLTRGKEDSMREIVSKGGVEQVLDAMKRFQDSSLVQAAGCWLLAIISRVDVDKPATTLQATALLWLDKQVNPKQGTLLATQPRCVAAIMTPDDPHPSPRTLPAAPSTPSSSPGASDPPSTSTSTSPFPSSTVRSTSMDGPASSYVVDDDAVDAARGGDSADDDDDSAADGGGGGGGSESVQSSDVPEIDDSDDLEILQLPSTKAPAPTAPRPAADRAATANEPPGQVSAAVASVSVSVAAAGGSTATTSPPSTTPPQSTGSSKRQNYASLDAGATILDAAPDMKGATNLLVPDKDRYMLLPCERPRKWVVVSLSEDIHADSIVIANYEKFSSTTRQFLVLGSVTYPTDTWVVLGNFTAAPQNGEQVFALDAQHHVRYVKLRILSHYGNEYYCTLSQLKVFGRTFTQVISQLEQSFDADAALEAVEADTGFASTPRGKEDAGNSKAPGKSQGPKADGPPSRPDPATSLSGNPSPSPSSPASPLPEGGFVDANGSPNNGVVDQCSLPPPSIASTTSRPNNTLLDVVLSASQRLQASRGTCAAHDRSAPEPTSPSSLLLELALPGVESTNASAGGKPEPELHIPVVHPPSTAAAIQVATQGLGRLESIFVRITKKIQYLEINQSIFARQLEELQAQQRTLASQLQARQDALAQQVKELRAVVHDVKTRFDRDVVTKDELRRQFQLVADEIRKENAALWNEMLVVREVITTMKAGILCALVLSLIIVVVYLVRLLIRCVTNAKRRADLREWLWRMESEAASTSEAAGGSPTASAGDSGAADKDPVGAWRLNHKHQFGSSWDDMAIERKTLLRDLVDNTLTVDGRVWSTGFHPGRGRRGRTTSLRLTPMLRDLLERMAAAEADTETDVEGELGDSPVHKRNEAPVDVKEERDVDDEKTPLIKKETR